MMRTGGFCASIARICTGEVWVRRSVLSVRYSVSCMSRAGWSRARPAAGPGGGGRGGGAPPRGGGGGGGGGGPPHPRAGGLGGRGGLRDRGGWGPRRPRQPLARGGDPRLSERGHEPGVRES